MENIVLDSITIVVDSSAMVAALVAIGVSLYTYYKTYDFYRYQELDNMYMRILEIGIEHPSVRDIPKTKDYENNFKDQEKIRYENYAYIVWNFC
ncbi:MAG: hypothetical protein ACRD6U_07250 [Nitrososphaeraceae archaeon]